MKNIQEYKNTTCNGGSVDFLTLKAVMKWIPFHSGGATRVCMSPMSEGAMTSATNASKRDCVGQ